MNQSRTKRLISVNPKSPTKTPAKISTQIPIVPLTPKNFSSRLPKQVGGIRNLVYCPQMTLRTLSSLLSRSFLISLVRRDMRGTFVPAALPLFDCQKGISFFSYSSWSSIYLRAIISGLFRFGRTPKILFPLGVFRLRNSEGQCLIFSHRLHSLS